MKVLVSAYSCAPGRGSEPGVGWNSALQIARFNETWVLTCSANRPEIERVLTESPQPGIRWVYHDVPWWAVFWNKGQRRIRLHYFLWQLTAYFVVRRLHESTSFDLLHHVTLVNYWLPCFLGLLPIPFVWGPLGGGESAPPVLRKSCGLRGRIYEHLRDLIRFVAELNPLTRFLARKCCVAVAATPETKKRLERLGCEDVKLLPAVALTDSEIGLLTSTAYKLDRSFSVLSAGRLVHLKGLHLGILAFSELLKTHPDAQYRILGEGPELGSLLRQVRALGISKSVRFLGQVPRQEVFRELSACDVLLHPGLHESGGYISLEAMASGKPVVSFDLAGLALQITSQTGFKIPVKTNLRVENLVAALAASLAQLAAHPDLGLKMGRAGRERIKEHFRWQRRGEVLRHFQVCALRKSCSKFRVSPETVTL